MSDFQLHVELVKKPHPTETGEVIYVAHVVTITNRTDYVPIPYLNPAVTIVDNEAIVRLDIQADTSSTLCKEYSHPVVHFAELSNVESVNENTVFVFEVYDLSVNGNTPKGKRKKHVITADDDGAPGFDPATIVH